MIKLPKTSLPQDTLAGLKRYQEAVDSAGSYPKRVQQACRQFPARNVRRNPVFRSVRETLDRMAHGARRCGYCEDSYADEVEHVRPKSLYPECVFRWSNYLYVCGACNKPKNNQFAVFLPRARKPTVVSRSAKARVEPPVAGSDAFINPRNTNPMDLLILDLLGTFLFLPLSRKGTRAHASALYTIEVLKLNWRDALVKARRNAFGTYKARLQEYICVRNRGDGDGELNYLRKDLIMCPHPTVWEEMKRQRADHKELTRLFAAAPEALGWGAVSQQN